MQTRSTLAFIGLATALMVSVSVAGAANIYVDNQLADDCTNGEYSIANRDDSGSDGDAYNTLQEAADVVSAGDTIYVRGGEYDSPGGAQTHPMLELEYVEATQSSPINITNYSAESVVIDGEYEKDWGIGLTECKWINIHGFEFKRFNRGGVQIYTSGTIGGAANIVVEYCEAYDCSPSQNQCAFTLLGPGHHITYRYLIAHDNALGMTFRESPTLSGSEYLVPPTAAAPEYEEDLPEEDWDSWEGWTSYAPRYCTMQNCLAYDHEGSNPEHADGIYSRYTIDSLYEGNISFRNTDDNMDMLAATRITFRRNIAFDADPNDIEDGDGNGIKIGVRGGLDCIVHHNVSFNNPRIGIEMADTERAKVYNNTTYNNEWYGIFTEAVRADSYGSEFVNNICADNPRRDLGSYLQAPLISWADHNCISDDNSHPSEMTQGENSLISTDPLFVDADSTVDTSFPGGLTIPEKLAYIRDQVEEMFALASTSPCIDAGTVISGITDSYNGSAPDMGAFEYGGNEVPTVDAGTDAEVLLPSDATLDGTVSDDSLPETPGAVTTTWTEQSGPGTVTFGNSSAVDTTAAFSETGTYVLRLTADDGGLSDHDEITITVKQNLAPTADAGADDEITLPNYATLDGTVSDDGLPSSPGTVTTTWTKDSGPGTVTFGDGSAVDTTAGFSTDGTYVLKLEASDGALSDSDTVIVIVNPEGVNLSPNVDAGSDDSITLPSNATLDGTVSDDDLPDPPAAVTTTWTKDSGPGTVTFGDASAVDTTAGFSAAGTYILQLEASDGDLSDSDTVQIVVNEEGTGGEGPFIEEGGTVVMECENYDDNDTRNDDSLDNWSEASSLSGFAGSGYMVAPGSGAEIWDDAAELGYDIDFTNAGTYWIWIRRYATSSADNSAFVGLDGTNIYGSSTDRFDNYNGYYDQWHWHKHDNADDLYISSGPHAFNVRRREGGYKIDRIILTTDDSYTPSGVGPAESSRGGGGPPTNQTPTADAGSDDSITLPDYATLDGTVSDDGLPDPPASVTTTWSKDSGPGDVTFGDASAVDTTAGFSESGVYVLQLLADDGTLSDSDTVQIVVNEEGTGGEGPFIEEGGTVVMECENYDDNDTRTDVASANWSEETSNSGYGGTGYMQAPSGSTEDWADGCELGYDIDFTNSGTYYIWIRRWCTSGLSNSAMVGLDGSAIPGSIGDRFDNYNGYYDQWYWQDHANPVYCSGGTHTFQIRRRESDYCVDRIILTTDDGYAPSGTGPAESSRQ